MLQFRAPRFRCNTTSYNSSTKLDYRAIQEDISGFKKFSSTVTGLAFQTIYLRSNFSFISHRIIDYYLPTPFSTSSTTYDASVEIKELRCQPYSMRYTVNVSYPRGVRHLDYQVDDPKIFRYPRSLLNYTQARWPLESNHSDTASYSSELQNFINDLNDLLPRFNEFALLDSFITLMGYKLEEVDMISLRNKSTLNQSSTGITHMIWEDRPSIAFPELGKSMLPLARSGSTPLTKRN